MPEAFKKMQTRASSFDKSTLDMEARTIEVVFASEAPVRRMSYETGRYDEILLCGRENVDLTRAANMSLLDSHGRYSLDDRLGSVVPGSVRFEKGQVLATVKLSRRAKAEELLQDLQDGHGLPISVGYKITREERTEPESRGGVATIKATRWQPLEISVVPIPADPNAKTRGLANMAHAAETTEIEGDDEERSAEEVANRKMTLREARGFVTEFTAHVKGMARYTPQVQALLKRGMTEQDVRNAFLEVAVQEQERSPTFPHVETRGMGGHASIRSAMADALMVRINSSHTPSNDAREFVGLSLPELARRALDANGSSSRGISAAEAVTRALHTTSDFAQVISGVGQTVLAGAYQSVPSALRAVARRTTAKDFKPKTTARLSGFADLEAINEHGEYKRGTFSESAESYKISTWGKVFGMTRQMIVNDELGAFADVTRELGQSAARLENTILAQLVNSNPNMADGKSVFHVDHKNRAASGGALSETTLSAARLAMGKQVGLAGELIDVVPQFLVVSLELQTTAEKLLAQIQPATSGDVNPFAGKLQLVIDRRLDAAPWYLAANPQVTPSLEYAYLEGSEGPHFETHVGFDVDGVETKVRVDFGAGWTDHRGWYKNPG